MQVMSLAIFVCRRKGMIFYGGSLFFATVMIFGRQASLKPYFRQRAPSRAIPPSASFRTPMTCSVVNCSVHAVHLLG